MLEIPKRDIQFIRESGEILSELLKTVSLYVNVGITTNKLDEIAFSVIDKHNAKPSFLGYEGFPKTICTSINEEVVHGIPKDRILEEGDIIGIDAGVLYKGYHTDAAITLPVGKISEEDACLIDVTRKSLKSALKEVKDGARLGTIGNAVQRIAENSGFSVVRDLTGHGIGKNLHEDPSIPNFGDINTGEFIHEGQVLAIEPMVNIGDFKIKMLDDGWTFVTLDSKKSAHFETTVLVTKNGYENMVPGLL
ncbi:type I methionyl aminopeptidase [bacterium]|nr:type I methionyl aminopeptidase [bacterium]